MFDIFKIERAENEYCPNLRFWPGEHTRTMIDWNSFRESTDANDQGESTIILGYWRPLNEKLGEKYQRYVPVYVLNSKGKQPIYLHKRQDKGYDIMFFLAKETLEGQKIHDLQEQIKGCIRVDGKFEETLVDRSKRSEKILGELSVELSLPPRKGLRCFAASYLPGQSPKEKTKRSQEKKKSSTNAKEKKVKGSKMIPAKPRKKDDKAA